MFQTRVAIAVAIASITLSASALAQSSVEGAGKTGELDCDGGVATITGASNTMTVTGRCTQLVIEGAGNRVHVELAPKGIIRISGASNEVHWTTPDGSKAQLRVSGAGNRVAMAR